METVNIILCCSGPLPWDLVGLPKPMNAEEEMYIRSSGALALRCEELQIPIRILTLPRSAFGDLKLAPWSFTVGAGGEQLVWSDNVFVQNQVEQHLDLKFNPLLLDPNHLRAIQELHPDFENKLKPFAAVLKRRDETLAAIRRRDASPTRARSPKAVAKPDVMKQIQAAQRLQADLAKQLKA